MISIGDCTIDAFIKLEEAELHRFRRDPEQEICFPYGDKLPYEALYMLSAGNSSNAAMGCARLGLKTAFYGTVGNDSNGKIILDRLKKEGIDTRYMKVQDKLPTNFHFVLWYRDDRTILIKHQPFPYALPKGIEDTEWMYLSSVGPKGLQLHPQIAAMLNANPDVKLSFNPGTFQLRMGVKKLSPLFKRTEILFVNKEEAELLAGRLRTIRDMAEALHKLGPKIVVITDGLNGAYCLENGVFYWVNVYPHKPYEATGCGDAFASGFTSARAHGLPVSEAMRWGSRNGAGVSLKVGPQEGLTTLSDMKKDLKKHPGVKSKVLKGSPLTFRKT